MIELYLDWMSWGFTYTGVNILCYEGELWGEMRQIPIQIFIFSSSELIEKIDACHYLFM